VGGKGKKNLRMSNFKIVKSLKYEVCTHNVEYIFLESDAIKPDMLMQCQILAQIQRIR
jgi:hypothetical protein